MRTKEQLAEEFKDLGVDVEIVSNGLILNNKFRVGALKNRWKVVGKNVWYWYSNPKQFVEDYIK
jgi:hypothetical protein